MRHAINRTVRFSTTLGASSSDPLSPIHKTLLDSPIELISGDIQDAETQAETSSLSKVSLRASLSHGRFFRCEDICFTNVTDLSRKIQPGELVIYRIGQDDPMDVIAEALARGAAGVLTEQLLPAPIPQCIVPCVDHASATLAACADADSESNLIVVGVVGPSGKSCAMTAIKAVLEKIPCQVSDHPYPTEPVVSTKATVKSESNESSSLFSTELIQHIQADETSGASVSLIELGSDRLKSGSYECLSIDILVVASPESREDDFGPSPLQCALECLSEEGVVICDASDVETRRPMRAIGHRHLHLFVDRKERGRSNSNTDA